MRTGLAACLAVSLLLCLLSSTPVSADGFSVGPLSLDVTMSAEGEDTACVYITSDFDGELIVDTEGVPFRAEPEVIELDDSWQQEHVELTFYGDPSVSAGTYEGKVTFLAYRGGNVAGGVKLGLTATQTGSGSVASIPATTPDDWLRDSYLFVVLPLMAVVALTVGILIGRRGRPRKAAAPARKGRHAVPRTTGRATR